MIEHELQSQFVVSRSRPCLSHGTCQRSGRDRGVAEVAHLPRNWFWALADVDHLWHRVAVQSSGAVIRQNREIVRDDGSNMKD